MTSADKFIAGAYFVFLATLLAYVVIFGAKIGRLEREVGELTELARRRSG